MIDDLVAHSVRDLIAEATVVVETDPKAELYKHFASVRIAEAMLRDAVVQIVEHAENQAGLDASHWMEAFNGYGDQEHPWSFETVCFLLRTDPQRVRVAVRALPKGTFEGRGGRWAGRRARIGFGHFGGRRIEGLDAL